MSAPPSWRDRLVSVDLADVMRSGVPAPKLRAGGLIYPAALTSITGESDTGKTMFVAHLATETLDSTTPVVWLDEETGRDGIADRLLALHADPDAVGHGLHYFEFPGLRWNEQQTVDFRDMLDELTPGLIVVDSSAATLVAAGLEENSNRDVGEFYKHLLKASRRSGAAVVVIDHNGRQDTGGKYARGASSKRNLVDVAYALEVLRPFNRQQSGTLRLRVTKDRFGYLHRAHEVAVLVDDGHVEIKIAPSEATSDEATGDDLQPAEAKILEALRATPAALTNSEIVDAVADKHGHGLRRETVSRALSKMLRLGLVDDLNDGTKRWLATTPNPEGVIDVTRRDLT